MQRPRKKKDPNIVRREGTICFLEKKYVNSRNNLITTPTVET